MTRTFIVAALVSPLLATAVAAQPTGASAPDPRWDAYIGCWRAPDAPSSAATRVCVTRDGAGVTITTTAGSQTLATERRVADGVAREVDVNGCRGTESARWSEVGQRLYRSATVSCDGGTPRTLATASFFTEGPAWVDVETVDDGGVINVRVSRLVPAAMPRGSTASTARGPAPEGLRRFTVADVIDLSAVLPPDGVQAAIAEAPAPFRLNRRALEQMADASVGDRVIDLMVGVTYPQKFQVRAMSSGSGGGGGFGGVGFGSAMADPFFSPIVGAAALYGCNSPYAWASNSYWGNCAYFDPSMAMMYPGFYNGYGYGGPMGPGWVITQPGVGGQTPGTPVEPQAEGRLVNGRGYTQVQPVTTASTAPLDSSGRMSPGGGVPNSGGGSSGVSGSGYSGGGSFSGGGGGDRTAVPRGPGGD